MTNLAETTRMPTALSRCQPQAEAVLFLPSKCEVDLTVRIASKNRVTNIDYHEPAMGYWAMEQD